MSVSAALAVIKREIENITPSATALTAVQVYPDEYSAKSPDVPFVVIERLRGVQSDRYVINTADTLMHGWTARIMPFLSQQQEVNPSADMAAAMLLEHSWERDIARALYANRLLDRTVIAIGEPGGAGFQMTAPGLFYLQWNQLPYYAMF